MCICSAQTTWHFSKTSMGLGYMVPTEVTHTDTHCDDSGGQTADLKSIVHKRGMWPWSRGGGPLPEVPEGETSSHAS